MKKHIKNKDACGNIEIDKSCVGDIIELTRTNPTCTRVLFTLANYADKTNSLITDVHTLSYILGEKDSLVRYSLNKLFDLCYIDIKRVEIDHSQDIFKYKHNKQVYNLTNHAIWRVIGTELIGKYNLKGIYYKFTVNEGLFTCKNNKENTLLLQYKYNLFYDTEIKSNELIWEE